MTSFPVNPRKLKIGHKTAKIYEYRYQTNRYYQTNGNKQQFSTCKISLPGIMTSFPVNLRKFRIGHKTAKMYEYRNETNRYYQSKIKMNNFLPVKSIFLK